MNLIDVWWWMTFDVRCEMMNGDGWWMMDVLWKWRGGGMTCVMLAVDVCDLWGLSWWIEMWYGSSDDECDVSLLWWCCDCVSLRRSVWWKCVIVVCWEWFVWLVDVLQNGVSCCVLIISWFENSYDVMKFIEWWMIWKNEMDLLYCWSWLSMWWCWLMYVMGLWCDDRLMMIVLIFVVKYVWEGDDVRWWMDVENWLCVWVNVCDGWMMLMLCEPWLDFWLLWWCWLNCF